MNLKLPIKVLEARLSELMNDPYMDVGEYITQLKDAILVLKNHDHETSISQDALHRDYLSKL